MLDQIERCLKHIFAKYCTPSVVVNRDGPEDFLTPPSEAYFSPEGLDKWVLDTNVGEILTVEKKEELKESLDTTEEGNLTCVKCAMTS